MAFIYLGLGQATIPGQRKSNIPDVKKKNNFLCLRYANIKNSIKNKINNKNKNLSKLFDIEKLIIFFNQCKKESNIDKV